MSGPVAHRRMEPADRGFVVTTWVESFAHSHFAGPFPEKIYATAARLSIEQLLKRSSVETWIAYYPEEPGRRFGYLVWERGPFHFPHRGGYRTYPEDCLHFVYVAKGIPVEVDGKAVDLRRQGVASSLLDGAGIDRRRQYLYSYSTLDGRKWAERVGLDIKFEPRCARLPRVDNPERKAA